MIFYAYRPTLDGHEPCGGDAKLLRRDLKSVPRFIASARRILGDTCRIVTIGDGDFYKPGSGRIVYDGWTPAAARALVWERYNASSETRTIYSYRPLGTVK